MRHREGKMTGARSLSIYYQYWEPETGSRALILLVHGAGEHSGRYQRFAEFFTARGYVVAALDHPGHGKSEGRYGHVERFDDFVDTLAMFHRQVSGEFPGLPQLLLGHSMGGLISSLYLLQHQQGMQQIQAEAGKITLPLLILHGGDDAMTAPEGSRFLHDAVGSQDKTLTIYPGLYHEIFNEPEREEIFRELADWCDRRVSAAT
jgi:alpha-beta hydrolase superfamily lysophospholipase